MGIWEYIVAISVTVSAVALVVGLALFYFGWLNKRFKEHIKKEDEDK